MFLMAFMNLVLLQLWPRPGTPLSLWLWRRLLQKLRKLVSWQLQNWWFINNRLFVLQDDLTSLFVLSDLSRTYTQDGVCLTESGLCQLQSLSATASRRRKPKPKLKLKIINQNSVAVLQAPVDPLSEHCRDEDMEENRGTGSKFVFNLVTLFL